MNIFIVPNMPHAMRQAPKLHASKMKTLPSSSQWKTWVSFIALCSFLSLLCSTLTPFCKIHMWIVRNISFHQAISIISNTWTHPKALITDFELIITKRPVGKTLCRIPSPSVQWWEGLWLEIFTFIDLSKNTHVPGIPPFSAFHFPCYDISQMWGFYTTVMFMIMTHRCFKGYHFKTLKG